VSGSSVIAGSPVQPPLGQGVLAGWVQLADRRLLELQADLSSGGTEHLGDLGPTVAVLPGNGHPRSQGLIGSLDQTG
jgi:hypothetical protein